MAKAVSINPAAAQGGGGGPFENKPYSAFLVLIKSSRFTKREYAEGSGIAPNLGITWVFETTKGGTFERTWSTGLPYDEASFSRDGKELYVSLRKNSDANYLISKAIGAGFPNDLVANDISVFEGHVFFMANDVNPNSRGSREKLYPKNYHPEGWGAAKADQIARQAAREARQSAPTYSQNAPATPQSTYAPPPIVQAGNVLQTAGEALEAILAGNGSAVKREQIPAKLNKYVEQTEKATKVVWDQDFRQNVMLALWDLGQLSSVVANNPKLVLDGETVRYK